MNCCWRVATAMLAMPVEKLAMDEFGKVKMKNEKYAD
jgi:hypothetical protein